MSYHITGFCAGHVNDIAALERLWVDFIQQLEALHDPPGEHFHGFIAGGDYGEKKLHAFHLTADEVRTGKFDGRMR